MKHLILASVFAAMSSAAFAAEPMTDEQMDQVSAGTCAGTQCVDVMIFGYDAATVANTNDGAWIGIYVSVYEDDPVNVNSGGPISPGLPFR